jgi:hypothetical protein
VPALKQRSKLYSHELFLLLFFAVKKSKAATFKITIKRKPRGTAVASNKEISPFRCATVDMTWATNRMRVGWSLIAYNRWLTVLYKKKVFVMALMQNNIYICSPAV